MRIMMSAAGSAVAPGIILHLQALGHYVIGHDCEPNGAGLRFCDEWYCSPRGGPADFSRQFDLYLPFLDDELRRAATGKIMCSRGETIAIFTSKKAQQDAFEQANLPVAPRTATTPCMLKGTFGQGGKNVIPLYAGGDLLVKIMSQFGVPQKLIKGDEYTVDVLTGLDGGFLFAVPRLRLQAKGVSVIGQVKMDPEIIALSRRIVETFKFAGPINIQMIRERETGKLYIIELNPRLSGSCMFTVMAGFDILQATIRVFDGEPFIEPTRVEEITVRRYYVEERA